MLTLVHAFRDSYSPPHLPGTFASLVSGWAFPWTCQMLRVFPNVCVLRVRMPISDDLSPRNFITKIVNYEKVLHLHSLTANARFSLQSSVLRFVWQGFLPASSSSFLVRIPCWKRAAFRTVSRTEAVRARQKTVKAELESQIRKYRQSRVRRKAVRGLVDQSASRIVLVNKDILCVIAPWCGKQAVNRFLAFALSCLVKTKLQLPAVTAVALSVMFYFTSFCAKFSALCAHAPGVAARSGLHFWSGSRFISVKVSFFFGSRFLLRFFR